MDEEDRHPQVTDSLMNWLELHYPDKFPVDTDDPKELLRQAGEIRLIRRLRAICDSQIVR